MANCLLILMVIQIQKKLVINDIFTWGNVTGYFKVNTIDTQSQKTAKSLTEFGFPKKVGGDFYISNFKKITNLEGCPEEVGGKFLITYCPKVTSLKGIPNHVGELFVSGMANLKELDYLPQHINTNVAINHNYKLESIKGLSDVVPSVNGYLWLNGNMALQSLEGCPSEVNGSFSIEKCKKIESLEGCPKYVGDDFEYKQCATRFKKTDVVAICDVKGNIDAWVR